MASIQVQKTRRGQGIWLPLVALLVGINLSLLLVMWITSDTDTPAASSTAARKPDAASETVQPDDTQPRSERQLSEQINTAEGIAPAPNVGIPEEPAGNVYAENTNDEYDTLPTLDELILENTITVSPLRLDIHVYSDDPSERFVFVKYVPL